MTEEDFEDAVTAVNCMQTECEHWKRVLQWTGTRGIQTYAMEHTVKKLASKTSEWLQRLFGSDQIYLRASFDEKERLHRVIESPHHVGVMSGGQWRRAQLASFMAWRELSSIEFPLLILDEVCTMMDMEGIRSVQRAIRDWCEESSHRTCFFISHEPEQHRDTSVYQNHVQISNKRGHSTLDDGASKRFKT